MSLPRRSKDNIPTTLPELANVNTNQSNNSILSTALAATNATHLEIKQSNASSGFDEDDNISIDSK